MTEQLSIVGIKGDSLIIQDLIRGVVVQFGPADTKRLKTLLNQHFTNKKEEKDESRDKK